MKKELSNKLNMFEALTKTCSKHESVWSDKPKFVEIYQKFQTHFLAAKELAIAFSDINRGYTRKKNALRKELVSDYKQLFNAVKSLAGYEKDLILDDKLAITPSRLLKMKEESFVANIKSVLISINAILDDLAVYNVGADDIERLNNKVLDFEVLIAEPRKKAVEKQTVGEFMTEKVQEAFNTLRFALDHYVKSLAADAPAFFREYSKSRRVIQLKGPGIKGSPSTDSPAITGFPPLEGPERDSESIS